MGNEIKGLKEELAKVAEERGKAEVGRGKQDAGEGGLLGAGRACGLASEGAGTGQQHHHGVRG